MLFLVSTPQSVLEGRSFFGNEWSHLRRFQVKLLRRRVDLVTGYTDDVVPDKDVENLGVDFFGEVLGRQTRGRWVAGFSDGRVRSSIKGAHVEPSIHAC
jgi:hypothetical protein